ncbi:DNA-directed RNA polymerase 1B [Abeliophyllum distichum]|uniref:DNA-directed RNA polymerase 1B n=1 Tax=Abeliophyllum distichum TaxID=126358 RepID=A0ABD1T085_9LAMI
MGGPNDGLCYSCRDPLHRHETCPKKQPCPKCGLGFVQWLQVGDKKPTRGKLFFNCSMAMCRYFKWDEGESSTVRSRTIEDDDDELSRILRACARILDEEDVETLSDTYHHSQKQSPKIVTECRMAAM